MKAILSACLIFFFVSSSSFAYISAPTNTLKRQVENTLKEALGLPVKLEQIGVESRNHSFDIKATVNGIRVHLEIATEIQGPVIRSVKVLDSFEVKGATQWEKVLISGFGFKNPRVLAHSRLSHKDGNREGWQLWVSFNGSEPSVLQLEAVESDLAKTDWVLAPFTYESQAFHNLASTASVHAALDLVKSFEAPLNQLGTLEVLIKSKYLNKKDFVFVDLIDSPIGFNKATEKQLQLPALVSDNTAYVTINTETGLLRAELFN